MMHRSRDKNGEAFKNPRLGEHETYVTTLSTKKALSSKNVLGEELSVCPKKRAEESVLQTGRKTAFSSSREVSASHPALRLPM